MQNLKFLHVNRFFESSGFQNGFSEFVILSLRVIPPTNQNYSNSYRRAYIYTAYIDR